MSSVFQTWLLFIVFWTCYCPQQCWTSPVVYSELGDDSADVMDTDWSLLSVEDNERYNDDDSMKLSMKRISLAPVMRHQQIRSTLNGPRHKHHRKEMSKRRLSAGEILQLLRQASQSRGAYARGRLKGMRFGVSRKRSIPQDYNPDQLPLAQHVFSED